MAEPSAPEPPPEVLRARASYLQRDLFRFKKELEDISKTRDIYRSKMLEMESREGVVSYHIYKVQQEIEELKALGLCFPAPQPPGSASAGEPWEGVPLRERPFF